MQDYQTMTFSKIDLILCFSINHNNLRDPKSKHSL
jgi:hypothetical protein